MKTIAMYLPQFHRVKENDEWWGEGFTDWVSAKSARPLFEGHYQPHTPVNENYYDLTEVSTLRWQTELMKKYGVDGACIYHYWFKDGRKILEKPAEILLNEKSIEMPFCFCWANETWARSWSGVRNAIAWSDILEQTENRSEGILLEQAYGDKSDWKKHFDYLLPFFEDERYIRIDNKPLFVIYKASDVPCLFDMISLWRNLAKENGLGDLYIIGSHISMANSPIDAELYHEPVRSRRIFTDFSQNEDVTILDYDKLWNEILRAGKGDYKTYFGGFCSYDDTPRRGNKGIIVTGGTPEKFSEYLTELMAKNAASGNDITFINAWNEWGEGMHLEPDERYGMGFLEAVKTAKGAYKERISLYNDDASGLEEINHWRKRSDKFEKYLNLLDDWMSLREKGISLCDEIKRRGWNRILIYGYGVFARHLLYELQNSDIQVVGIMDKHKAGVSTHYPVYGLGDEIPHFDEMIVASFFYYHDIYMECKEYRDKMISIEQLIQNGEE